MIAQTVIARAIITAPAADHYAKKLSRRSMIRRTGGSHTLAPGTNAADQREF
jgi:hypothetical protein